MTASDPTQPVQRSSASFEEVPEAAVVTVGGEIDLDAERELRAVLELATAAAKPVLVDLTACTFIDSTGLGVLLVAVRAARERQLPLVVASAPDGPVSATLRLMMGPTMFTTCATRAEGLAALAGHDG